MSELVIGNLSRSRLTVIFFSLILLSDKNKAMKGILLFLGNMGMQEILLIGLFVLVFFGAKKIPDFMKGLGKGVREFKDAVKDVKKEVEESSKIEEGK